MAVPSGLANLRRRASAILPKLSATIITIRPSPGHVVLDQQHRGAWRSRMCR
jgi:hypothetical protein